MPKYDPPAISLERAKELLRQHSKLPAAVTDEVAELWYRDPGFNRSKLAAKHGMPRTSIPRLLKKLKTENTALIAASADGLPPAVSPHELPPDDEHTALSGPQLLAMLDTQLRAADADGRNRDFQVLLSARQQIADAASEVAAASVDPMRLCGKRGMNGLPERLIKVIDLLRPYMEKRYPMLWTYLCEFGPKADSPSQPAITS